MQPRRGVAGADPPPLPLLLLLLPQLLLVMMCIGNLMIKN